MRRFIPGFASLLAALTLMVTLALPATVAGATATVRITDRLEPATVRVAVGGTVVWRNESGERHRMRSVDHSGGADWDTGDIEPGESASVRFSTAGTFAYVDERDDDNSSFHGTVVVGGPDGAATPPATSTPAAPDSPGPPAAPSAATVSMAGRAFSPASVSISAGGTVTFRNDDDDAHTATASDVSWDSGVLAAGTSFDRRFPTPGTFTFLCLIHPDMQGTIQVRGSASAQPVPPAVPSRPGAVPTRSPAATPRASAAADPAAPSAPVTVNVAMVDLAFEPARIETAPGTTIRWTNRGQSPHTVTAEDGTFDSGFVSSGGTYTVTLDSPGTYAYVCQLHPGMAGSIVVAAGAGSPTGTGEDPAAATAAAPEPSTGTEASPSPPAATATAPPVAVAQAGEQPGARPGPPAGAAPVVAPARAGFDPGRLGIVVLLVGSAMLLFGKIVRATVRPG